MLTEVRHGFAEHDLLTRASAIAFQMLTALLPLAFFGVALVGAIGHAEVWTRHFAPDVRSAVPHDVFQVLDRTARSVLRHKQSLWLTGGALLAVWEMSGAMRATIGALNSIHRCDDRRGFWHRMALSTGLSVVVTVLLLAAVGAARFGGELHWGVPGFLLQWAVVILLLFAVVALSARFGPPERRPWRWVSFGAALTVGAWLVFSLGFSFYLANFASYGSLIGALATLFIVAQYLYLSAIVFLAGFLIDCIAQYGGRSAYQSPSTRNAAQNSRLAPSSSKEASMSGT